LFHGFSFVADQSTFVIGFAATVAAAAVVATTLVNTSARWFRCCCCCNQRWLIKLLSSIAAAADRTLLLLLLLMPLIRVKIAHQRGRGSTIDQLLIFHRRYIVLLQSASE